MLNIILSFYIFKMLYKINYTNIKLTNKIDNKNCYTPILFFNIIIIVFHILYIIILNILD